MLKGQAARSRLRSRAWTDARIDACQFKETRMTIPSLVRGTLLLALAMASPAWAQAPAYPSKAVRVFVGYAAGGPVDNAFRRIAPAFSKELGQSVVIENRAGAGGVLAADAVAKAEPDGYTLIFQASPTVTMTPHMMKSVPFDPIKDFTPISMVVGFATTLVVNKDFPARNLQQLIAYARANPGKVSYGSAGIGASNHLSGELLAKRANLTMIHAPYKGNALALTDVISGQLSFMFNSIGDSVGFLEKGQLRALAVSSKARSRVLPDVPTMIESGVPDFDVTAWYALQAPPRLPRPIVNRLNTAIGRALADPTVAKQFHDIGYDVMPGTPEELAATVQADFERWGPVARSIKID